MIKKITLAVLGVIASSVVAAGTMGPVCEPGNVTVPCEARLWDLGVQALYLRPLYDANKAYLHNIDVTHGYGEERYDWDWGYRLEGSLHFNTGNDITATWVHYTNDSTLYGFQGFIPFSPLLPPLNSGFSVDVDNQFDQVNLVMGQIANFGLVKKMRFYGGAQYAYIHNYETYNFILSPAQLIPNGITSVYQYDRPDFRGVGPVFGIDYSYDFTSAFSITANAAGSILYGTNRISNGYVGNPVGAILTSVYGSKRAIVPSIEAKLGVNYAWSMAQGILNIQAGYQAMDYFNAVQTPGITGFALLSAYSSDYGLYGPYFGLKYVGNA